MIDEKEICDCNNSGNCIGGGPFIRMYDHHKYGNRCIKTEYKTVHVKLLVKILWAGLWPAH